MGRTIIGSLAAIVASLTAVPALAAADYFLEIKGTKGETRDKIHIEAFSWGVSNAGSFSRRQSASAHHGALQVTGVTTSRGACTAGTRYAQATFHTPAGAWDLHGVVVSGCPSGGMTLSYQHAQAARATKSRSNIQNN